MKKKIINLISAIFLSSVFFVNIVNANVSVTSLSMDNINHLASVMTKLRKNQVCIINVANCENSSATCVARIYIEALDRIEDYALTVYSYQKNLASSLPFNTVEEGNAIFGPNWYYYGIYSQRGSSPSGYVVAEKINTWPTWENLSFSGKTNRGVRFEGTYSENNDKNYIKNH